MKNVFFISGKNSKTHIYWFCPLFQKCWFVMCLKLHIFLYSSCEPFSGLTQASASPAVGQPWPSWGWSTYRTHSCTLGSVLHWEAKLRPSVALLLPSSGTALAAPLLVHSMVHKAALLLGCTAAFRQFVQGGPRLFFISEPRICLSLKRNPRGISISPFFQVPLNKSPVLQLTDLSSVWWHSQTVWGCFLPSHLSC